ncbi:MAG TPA: hypothetical protein VE153_14690 [Myxococcus sp.]|jgi:hypothetical protein|nr:hypothetical protein [Myxococcus sp.]
MDFTLMNIDLDCSLGNPVVATAYVLSALLLGTWMTWVLLSRRTARQKALHLGAAVVLASAGTPVASRLALRAAMGMPFGCIISPPPFLGAVAALACAGVLFATVRVFRRLRSARAL